jgi:broad specificity phosphatase PhoE
LLDFLSGFGFRISDFGFFSLPMTSTHLWLLRHAEVEDRYHRVFGGRLDMGLSPTGLQQAEALGRWLAHQTWDAIYASPMKRAQQTLAAVARNGAPRPIAVEGFREVDFGDWTGLTWEEVLHKHQVQAWDWLNHLEAGTVPNGETGAAFRARIEPDLLRIIRQHAGGTVAIVAHGGVIRMMLAVLLELSLAKTAAFDIEYASATHVELRPHGAEVQLLNFAPWRDIRP